MHERSPSIRLIGLTGMFAKTLAENQNPRSTNLAAGVRELLHSQRGAAERRISGAGCEEPPLHILLLATTTADYSIEYANALAGRVRLTLLAPETLLGPYVSVLDGRIELHLLRWPRHRSLRNPLFLVRLVALIRRLRPDVVHFLAEGVTWLALITPALRGYGLVTTMHDVSYHPGDHESRRVPRRFADWLVGQSDRVIVHGDALQSDAERKYERVRGRIGVLPHVQIRRYLQIAQAERMRRSQSPSINVLFFGRIYAYKGLDVLIRAIPAVAEQFPRIAVTIAGAGNEFEKYRQLIADHRYFDVRNRRIPDQETAQLFTAADIVVLPYREASQSGVLAIANTFGKSVIVTNVGELGRSVENGVSGLVVPAGDATALAEAILRLARDAELRARLGDAGRRAGLETASPDRVADMAIEIYRQAARSQVRAALPSA